MEMKLIGQRIYARLASLSGNFYKTLFLICSGIALIVIPILSFDAGITDDDRIENEHGINIMNYYLGTDTIAAASPIDSNGEWILKTRPLDFSVNKNIYGGFFDLACAVLYKYVTSHLMGEYESKHFFGAISGVMLFLITGLIALRLTGSWSIALLALLFSILSPRLVGHAFNDPKDIPFAAVFAFGLYHIIMLLQTDLRVTWLRALALIVAIIVAIDIRVGGVILIFYLLFFAGMLAAYRVFLQKQPLKKYIISMALLSVISIAGYLGASLFWPWAAKNPFLNPLITLRIFSNFNQFNSLELFEGSRINGTAIPWYFAPKWFYISFPPLVVFGLVAFPLFAWKILTENKDRIFTYALVIFSFAFPVLSVILQHSNLYDDARHLYFTLPAVICLSAVAWHFILRNIRDKKVLYPTMVLFSLLALEPLAFMLRNHPLEAIYFSPAIGGTQGAFKNYEMDYWGFSLRSALDWIEETDSVQAPHRRTRVRLWYGEQLKISYYCAKSQHLEYIRTRRNSPDWDYTLVLPAESKVEKDLINHWPPRNTIHQIFADGAPICAIVRNAKSDLAFTAPKPDAPVVLGDILSLLNSGMSHLTDKEYNLAAIDFKNAIIVDSINQRAWNNLIFTYNQLEMYDAALEVADKAVVKFPAYALLSTNRVKAKEGAARVKRDESYLTKLAYNYFAQRNFKASIQTSKELIRINPQSIAAYNNICASYNNLGDFTQAKEYGQKGVAVDSTSQLMQNNLKVARRGLGEI